jgi:hypothetical protein
MVEDCTVCRICIAAVNPVKLTGVRLLEHPQLQPFVQLHDDPVFQTKVTE